MERASMKPLIPIALCAAAIITADSPARSQVALQVKRVGVVLSSPTGGRPYVAALRDGLRELGWVEGRDIAFEPRFYEAKPERIGEVVKLISESFQWRTLRTRSSLSVLMWEIPRQSPVCRPRNKGNLTDGGSSVKRSHDLEHGGARIDVKRFNPGDRLC